MVFREFLVSERPRYERPKTATNCTLFYALFFVRYLMELGVIRKGGAVQAVSDENSNFGEIPAFGSGKWTTLVKWFIQRRTCAKRLQGVVPRIFYVFSKRGGITQEVLEVNTAFAVAIALQRNESIERFHLQLALLGFPLTS